MFRSGSHCLFSLHQDLSSTHLHHSLLLHNFVSDDTRKNSIKPNAIMDKIWIAIGTSLGILLGTVTIVMIIYFWKFRNQKGISNIFLKLCVLISCPSKCNTSHVLKCINKKSVELYLCFTESVATSL